MSDEVEKAIKRTQEAFTKGVWPEVAEAIGGGTIIPVEAVSDKEFLDQYSGIDHWHVLENRHLVRGIASRCQWPKYKMFQAFTLRIGRADIANTELAKRMHAMEHADQGWVRPHLFIQAFFAQPQWSYDTFLYAGIARLDDLLVIVRDGKKGSKQAPQDWYEEVTSTKWGQKDRKAFAVIPWDSVVRRGCPFRKVSRLPANTGKPGPQGSGENGTATQCHETR